MVGLHRAGRQHRQAIVHRKHGGDRNQVAQRCRLRTHPGLGDDAGDMLLHRVPRPRRGGRRATIQNTRRDLLHPQLIQRKRHTARHPRKVRGAAEGFQL